MPIFLPNCDCFWEDRCDGTTLLRRESDPCKRCVNGGDAPTKGPWTVARCPGCKDCEKEKVTTC